MVVERDRSTELYSLFDGIRSSSLPTSDSDAVRGLHSSNEVQTFNRFAQAFSRDIANVSDSIMRLTKITNSQSVFDDQSTEISGLTQVVKTSLQRLHNDLDTLEELKRRALTSQKASAQRSSGPEMNNFFARQPDASKTSQKHSDTVVETLKSRLARTGQEFRSTLQHQSKHMKQNAARRHLFTAADRPQTFESALFQDQEQHMQQQQLVSGTSNVQYYRQRAEAVREIEAAVAEVGELFSDFTRLVHEQDEVVLRIDTDVDDALRNVNAGSNELMRYLSNLSSNRGLIMKIFAMLFFFLMFFGFVVVR